MAKIHESELILNPDGSVYHLALKPGQLAETIFLVGDPGRVEMVSKYFDHVEHKVQKREFITHTGTLNGHRLSVLSTGIGTDNIDIVLNECDAVFNVDFNAREPKSDLKSLRFIRLGTSGALEEHIEVDSFLASAFAIGLDGLQIFYPPDTSEQANGLENAMRAKAIHVFFPENYYCVKASDELLAKFEDIIPTGITVTSCGFYGPQGRSLRLESPMREFVMTSHKFSWNGLSICNFEMETSAIYLLSQLLGHEALSINAIIANRKLGKFSSQPSKTIDKMIRQVLELLTS
jgi:uridine phosphorylase